MKQVGWKSRIKKACTAAGTYREEFGGAISTLADIMSKRDAAQEAFDADGGEILVEYTNKGGGKNQAVHPAFKLVTDLNRDALAYWTALGLTPAGLKKINEDALKPRKRSALGDALKDCGPP